mmetsp:Transcript_15083/g.45180  ORF Transcript_15083/g.45180 Transcript_15083/m.45180 type:complete len:1183 (-) Transcript_15083:21-3569(-)
MGQQYSAEVFKPPDPPTYTDALPGLFYINGVEGRRIPAVFHAYRGRKGQEAFYTILYSTGNTTDMGLFQSWVKVLSQTLRVNILTYDYCGYGLNDGTPSEKRCYEDIQSAYEFLVGEKRIPSERVVLYGRSLGSGPTVHLAAQLCAESKRSLRSVKGSRRGGGSRIGGSAIGGHPSQPQSQPPPASSVAGAGSSGAAAAANGNQTSAESTDVSSATATAAAAAASSLIPLAAVVLQSPMTSVLGLLDQAKFRMLPDMFENYKKAEKVTVPVCVFHGTSDQTVALKHGAKLASKFPALWQGELLRIEEASHFDIETAYSDDLLDPLIDFLQHVGSFSSAYSSHAKAQSALRSGAGRQPNAADSAQDTAGAGAQTAFASRPSPYSGPAIGGWLDSIGLAQYERQFILGGFTDPDFLLGMQLIDLQCMGIDDVAHCDQILDAVAERSGVPRRTNSCSSAGNADAITPAGTGSATDDTTAPSLLSSSPDTPKTATGSDTSASASRENNSPTKQASVDRPQTATLSEKRVNQVRTTGSDRDGSGATAVALPASNQNASVTANDLNRSGSRKEAHGTSSKDPAAASRAGGKQSERSPSGERGERLHQRSSPATVDLRKTQSNSDTRLNQRRREMENFRTLSLSNVHLMTTLETFARPVSVRLTALNEVKQDPRKPQVERQDPLKNPAILEPWKIDLALVQKGKSLPCNTGALCERVVYQGSDAVLISYKGLSTKPEVFIPNAYKLCCMPPHPGVTRVLGLGLQRGNPPALLLESNGKEQSLRDWLAACKGQLTDAERIELCSRLCLSLTHLHHHDVVHGQLRTSAISMLPGNQASPRIGGFMMEPCEKRSVFRSPESYAGATMDAAADVYALGVILWEVVAGKPPKTLPTAGKTAASPPPSLHECDPMWHPLLSACWQTDPTSRPTAHQAFQMLPDECDLQLEQLSFLHSDSASDEFVLSDDSADLDSEDEEESDQDPDGEELAVDDSDSDSTDEEGDALDFGAAHTASGPVPSAESLARHSLVYRDLEPQPVALLQDMELRLRACPPDVEVRAGFDQDPNASFVHVHSVVLRARCPALRQQLESGLRVFSAPCSSTQALRAVLRTVYKGSQVRVPDRHLKDASNVARWLGLSRLACTLDRLARQSSFAVPLCTVVTSADNDLIRHTRSHLVKLYEELAKLKKEEVVV